MLLIEQALLQVNLTRSLNSNFEIDGAIAVPCCCVFKFYVLNDLLYFPIWCLLESERLDNVCLLRVKSA